MPSKVVLPTKKVTVSYEWFARAMSIINYAEQLSKLRLPTSSMSGKDYDKLYDKLYELHYKIQSDIHKLECLGERYKM